MNIKHKDEDSEFEHAVIDVGGWVLFVSEEDGIPRVNIPDHGTVRVTGTPKDEPTISIDGGEFATDIEVNDLQEPSEGHTMLLQVKEGARGER